MEREFPAMGTDWGLRADIADAGLLERAVELVGELEQRLSRFLPDSALSRLNRERAVEDELVAALVREPEDVRRQTGGSFDARIGAAVLACGYERSFEQIATAGPIRVDRTRPLVAIDDSRVWLSGEGLLDLGGTAKGWSVDRVADLLSQAGPCLVDGGGDIAVRGRPLGAEEWLIGVGDGLAVGLCDGAVATSSTLRRRWRSGEGAAHHVIDPSLGRPAEGALTAVVIAPTASLADALATALVADAARALPALAAVEAEALLQFCDGRWQMTPGMERYLR